MYYRIDTFSVPEKSRARFLERSDAIMAVLHDLPGFVSGESFEKIGGPGSMDIVTVVTWRDRESADAAGSAVRARHTEQGFDPAAFSRDLGVVESKALYTRRPASPGQSDPSQTCRA